MQHLNLPKATPIVAMFDVGGNLQPIQRELAGLILRLAKHAVISVGPDTFRGKDRNGPPNIGIFLSGELFE